MRKVSIGSSALLLSLSLALPAWSQGGWSAPRPKKNGAEAHTKEDQSPPKKARASSKKKSRKTSRKENRARKKKKGPQRPNKISLEDYLRKRTAKINAAHKVRLDFMAEEKKVWDSFWEKNKNDRLKFELRITRQRLGLIDSLASLDRRDHKQAISDYERLQANVVHAFEGRVKTRIEEFFTYRDERFSDFAQDQEIKRAWLSDEAQQAWANQKAGLR